MLNKSKTIKDYDTVEIADLYIPVSKCKGLLNYTVSTKKKRIHDYSNDDFSYSIFYNNINLLIKEEGKYNSFQFSGEFTISICRMVLTEKFINFE